MKIQNKYEKVEKIGAGSFSKIYKVRNRKTKQFLCLKEIDLSLMTPQMRRNVENEVGVLKRLQGPFVLKLVESYRIESNSSFRPCTCKRCGDTSFS
jgi:serine/threonine protein kinase